MNIIIGKRGSGKTTELVKESAEKKIMIVAVTKRRIREILEVAKRLNLIIPYPITVAEYINDDTYRGPVDEKGEILIDDADEVLQHIFNGVYVSGITLTNQGNLRYLDGGNRTYVYEPLTLTPEMRCNTIIPNAELDEMIKKMYEDTLKKINNDILKKNNGGMK